MKRKREEGKDARLKRFTSTSSKAQLLTNRSCSVYYFRAVGFQLEYRMTCLACPYKPMVAMTIKYGT